MTIRISELSPSREGVQGPDPSCILRYRIEGDGGDLLDPSSLTTAPDTDRQVRALVWATSPRTYDVLIRQEIQTEQVGNQVWEASVKYGKRPAAEGNANRFSFQVGLQSAHITHSLETVASYGNAPDFEGAVNVRQDSNGTTVDGIDTDVPVLEWEESHHILLSSLTTAYISTLYLLAGTTNNAPWRIFDTGEARFLGVSGDAVLKAADGSWLPSLLEPEATAELTFRFAASPNVSDLTIGSITGVDKRGWDFLWVGFEKDVDNATNDLVAKPKFVKVERIFRQTDFNLLLIPNPWA